MGMSNDVEVSAERRALSRSAASVALKVALFQLVFGVFWIVGSDAFVAAVASSSEHLNRLQTFKGVTYMVIAFGVMFLVVYRLTASVLDHKSARAKAEREVIERLAMAAEWRDDETGDHVRRVSETAAIVARKYGLDAATCQRVRIAAAMHDIGKIGVPDEIVMFEGRYNLEQRLRMNAHTLIGGQILRNARGPLMVTARNVALYHHEKWDGTGYPEKLSGEAIPIEARITAVADVLDALFSKRRYKDAWPWVIAVQEIVDGSGTHFDPKVVDAFVAAAQEIRAIYEVAINSPYVAERRFDAEYSWLTATDQSVA
jgi:HD-GYP domain-containing protein (c-di-GMP phosphodiesterase class II)